jgi:lipoprotein Spr
MRICWITIGSVFRFVFILLFIFETSSCRSRKGENSIKTSTEWEKIERRLGVSINQQSEILYYKEVCNWLGAPYKLGGNTPQGTDCSGFVTVIYERVFGIKLPRQSAQQAEQLKPSEKRKLKPGDLYFFNTSGKGVSHVGMHLTDDFFIHASTQKGVIVSNLSESYYSKAFVGYGNAR